jgi:hypothetical protein
MATKTLQIGKSPVTIDPVNGIIRFIAPMTIDGDGGLHTYGPNGKGRDDLKNAMTKDGHFVGIVTVNGLPYLRPDGYYVSTTSYQRDDFSVCDPKRYLDAETIPFIAIPPQLIKAVPHIVIGSRVIVRYGVITAVAVVGDIGPSYHLGEGSEALAKLLGIDPNPRSGGIEKPVVTYEIHAGTQVTIKGETFELQRYQG